MLPSNWFALATFFVLIAPGVLFRTLANRRRVARSETALQEAGSVILTSVCFSTLGLAASALLAKRFPALVLPPDDIAFGTVKELREAPGSLVATTVSVLVVSLMAVLIYSRLMERSQSPTLSNESGWWQALRKDLPAGHYPVARVQTVSGEVLVGRVRSYTADFEVADRELTLVQPISIKAKDEEAAELLPEGWQRLVISGAQVAQIAVAYAPDPELATAPQATETWSWSRDVRGFHLSIRH